MLPSSLLNLLSSGMASLLITSVLRDLFLPSNRPPGSIVSEDESVDSFLSRRFGPKFTQTFGSALVHGIYAADSRILSVRAAFPTIWDAHLRGAGSVARSMFNRKKKNTAPQQVVSEEESYKFGAVDSFMRGTSVFSFRGGVSDMTDALDKFLLQAPNVELVKETVTSLSSDSSSSKLKVRICY